jgi:DNA polymerase-4
MKMLSWREQPAALGVASEAVSFVAGHPLFLALEVEDFPAQTLAAWDPALRGQAFVVVNQDPDNHKTFVMACSPEARHLGARAGMPYAVVRRRWRSLPARFPEPAWEAALLEELRALCYAHTPEFLVRDNGCAVLDLTGTPALREALRKGSAAGPLGGSAPSSHPSSLLARRLQHAIRSQTGLQDVALGLAATRLMARVMARQAHPAGLRICPPGREAETLAPLPPSLLPGLSPQCRERIRRYAFETIGHLRAQGRQALAARFGTEGEKLYTLACGLDLAPVPERRRPIEAETTLEEDINDDDALARKVRLVADQLAFRLRQEGAVAAKLTVTVRYSDHRSARKTLTVAPATDGFKELADLALRGFRAAYTRRVALRAIHLSVRQPDADRGQTDLFEGLADLRARALGDALTKIRKRSGFEAILSAG